MENVASVLTKFNKSSIKKGKLRETVDAYLMLGPQILGFLIFTLYPLGWAIRLSWFNYNGILSNTRFVGWDNFVKIFTTDTSYWSALLNTFLFTAMKIPIELPLALMLAVLLNRKIKGRGFFRAMFYLPNIVSIAIIGLVFSNMFSYFGVINSMLIKWGIVSEGVDWFANKGSAFVVIVIAAVWQTFGVNVLYFLAALQNIPEELYECAKLDGAKKGTIFFKVTLPMMAPVMQIIIMLSIIGTLQVNDLILVMTNGAPGGQTFTVMPYLVKNFVPGFAGSSASVGYGCALSIVTASIFGLVTFVYMRISKKLSSLY